MAKVKDPTAPKYTYDDYAKEVSNKFVEMLESGTAPWQKEWKGAELSSIFPRNASTGKNYNGINVLNLMAEAQIKNYDDPRWVTYNQAKAMGGSVKAGEKSSKIEFWQFGKEIDKLDENGKPILGEDGKPEKVFMRYQTPTHTFHSVFNVTQCDGIPPLTKEELTPQREFIPIEMAEKILHNSGAIINFDKNGRSAYYQPHSDQITLPSKELFSSEMGFYSTALHELGHWTGHDSRLNRDMSHPFGSDGYAKEELRAEIASFMLCSELGVDFDPTNHGAYVKSWCKNLEEEPKEIFRASSDALKITNYVMALSLEKEKEVEKDYHSDPLVLETKRLTDITRFNETDLTNRINATPHQNLSIPKEAVEDAIKRYGILEHKDDTIRYVELKINDELFILNETPTHGILTPRDSYNDTMFKDMAWSGSTTTTLTPQSEQTMNIEPPKKSYPTIQNPNAKYPNATVLNVDYHSKDKASLLGARWEQSEKTWVAPIGTDLSKLEQWLVAPQKEIREYKDPYVEFGEALKEKGLILDGDPIMDGKIHRVQVEGDKLNQKSGAYSGHLDGRPAGYIQNYKTDERVNWKAQSFNQDNVVSLNPTPEQQEAKKLANEQKAIERQKEIEAKHNEVSVNVRTKFNEAREVGLTHPYLDAKGVQNYGLKLDERNNLLMPLRDIDDKIWTAQAINTNFKGFEKDGKKEGNFFTIGEHHSTSKELLICEGYATGASIHEATGKGVIVAVDAGNLEAVGVALRERYPDKVIAFMADDDISKATDGKKNVGRLSAEEASEVVKGVVVYPQLTASEIKDGKSDFNDIHKSRGLAELKSQLTLKMDKFLVKEDRALTPQRDKAVEPAKGLER